MPQRKTKTAAKQSDAEELLQDYEPATVEIVRDRVELLADALNELRMVREREAALCLEVKRLMAETVANDNAREQLWRALRDLREWHKEEYQSNRRIDAQADEALTLFSPIKPGWRPN